MAYFSEHDIGCSAFTGKGIGCLEKLEASKGKNALGLTLRVLKSDSLWNSSKEDAQKKPPAYHPE